MSKKEVTKRYILFIVSLFFIGVGIAFTKHGELGVSPISSMANVVSLKFTELSFGMWLTISNCALLLGQILLLRRNFKPIQLLQIPLSFLFGYFSDLGLVFARIFPNDAYVMRLALVFIGIIIIAFGITLSIIANVIMNSGEAIIKAISDVSAKDFGTVKVVFDVSWVLLSVIVSLLLFDGKVCGTREGTLLSAVFVGIVVKLFRPILTAPITKILEGRR